MRRGEALRPPLVAQALAGRGSYLPCSVSMLGASAWRIKVEEEHGPPFGGGRRGQEGLRFQVMLAHATQDGCFMKGLKGARLQALMPRCCIVLWSRCVRAKRL